MPFEPKDAVVVPLDFSNESFAALDEASKFVQDSSHLHLIHVLPPLVPSESGVLWEAIDDDSRRLQVEDALRKRLAGTPHAQAKLTVTFGDAPREITEFAASIKANLIVIPSHGRTGISRFFLGSVAERVVRFAHCPVLVLRN